MASLFGSRFGSRSKGDEPPQPTSPPSPLTNPRPTTFSQQPLGFETVLGAGSALEGKLKTEGNIRLDGIFTGTLEISGNVLVGETATITADINAKNISIAGSVRGNVSGNKVQLLRTGKVWGNITATALTTEEGAFIDGKITMHAAPPQNETSPASLTDTIAPADDDITLPAIPIVSHALSVDDEDQDEQDEPTNHAEHNEQDDVLDSEAVPLNEPDFISQALDDDLDDQADDQKDQPE